MIEDEVDYVEQQENPDPDTALIICFQITELDKISSIEPEKTKDKIVMVDSINHALVKN